MLRWPFRDCGLLVEKRIIQGSSCDDFPYVYYIGREKKNEGEKMPTAPVGWLYLGALDA